MRANSLLRQTALLLPLPFFGLLALYLGQDLSWDLHNYHWYNAYAFLNKRYEQDLLPNSVWGLLNPLIDVPFYLLASHVTPRLAYFILGCFQGLNFVLLFLLAKASVAFIETGHKNIICIALAALGMLSGMGISEIGMTFGDNITSIGILVSLLLIVRRFGQSPSMPWKQAGLWLAPAGFIAGAMMGLKLTMGTFFIGIFLALAFAAGNQTQRNYAFAFFFGLGGVFGFLLTYGYWGWHLYTRYGSPFFPYFNNIFHSPLFPPVSINVRRYHPTFSQFLVFPLFMDLKPTTVNEIVWRDFRMAALYILVLAQTVSFGLNKIAGKTVTGQPLSRFLLCAGVFIYILWLRYFQIYRYLLPLDMLAPLLILLLAEALPLKEKSRRIIAFCVLGAIAVTIKPGDWGRRTTWSQNMVEITMPIIKDPANTMVLLAGDDAYANTITQFPPQVSFVGIDKGMFDVKSGYPVMKLFKEKVMNYRGHIMIYTPVRQRERTVEALKYYGLAREGSTCQPITDKLYDPAVVVSGEMVEDYELCDVKRIR